MKKSQLLQFLLTLLLGPIGLLYSNIVAAIVLLVAAIALSAVIGLAGSVTLWPISMVVGFFTTNKFNTMIEKEDEKYRKLGQAAKNTELESIAPEINQNNPQQKETEISSSDQTTYK